MISEAEQQDIMAAVAEAESQTEGEIVCVFAHRVSHYSEIPLAAGTFAALVLPPVAMALGLHPAVVYKDVVDAVGPMLGWTAYGLSADAELGIILEGYAVLQGLLFVAVAMLASLSPVRRVLTPASLKHHRVHKAAWAQFAATGLHTSDGPTGVVIFASLDDRMVEILASEGIHKAVGDKVWNEAVAAVKSGMKARAPVKGFVRAVEICGAALATHFPSKGERPNGLSDRLLEL